MGYPDTGSKIWLIEDEGNQVAHGYLSALDEKPAIV